MNAFNVALNQTIARMHTDELRALLHYLSKYPDVPVWSLNGENVAPRHVEQWKREGKYPAAPSELESCLAQAHAALNAIYQEEDLQADHEAKTGRCMDCGHLIDECICD